MRPFFKAVGGKSQLLHELLSRVPKSYGTYHEIFAGGAALFFDLAPPRAVLNDTNKAMMRTYAAVRDNVEGVIGILSACPNDKNFFESMRAVNPEHYQDDVDAAAWFLYLNRTAYSGLFRVNRAGRFNVPFGGYSNPTICDPDRLREASAALQGVVLRCMDFAVVMNDAREGDFVFADCPYIPLSKTSSFVGYGKDGFTMADQIRLRDVALELKRKGVHVLLSNSSAPEVYKLYADGFTIEEVYARRNINSNPGKRGPIKELLIG